MVNLVRFSVEQKWTNIFRKKLFTKVIIVAERCQIVILYEARILIRYDRIRWYVNFWKLGSEICIYIYIYTTKNWSAMSEQLHHDTCIIIYCDSVFKHVSCPISYDMHIYHSLYFCMYQVESVRVSGVRSISLFIFHDFWIFLKVPLLSRPPLVKDPLIRRHHFVTRRCLYTLLSTVRRSFMRCTLMSHEEIPVGELHSTYFILHKAELVPSGETILISHVPQGGLVFSMLREADSFISCISWGGSLLDPHRFVGISLSPQGATPRGAALPVKHWFHPFLGSLFLSS